MSDYSREMERSEKRRIGSGIKVSVFGLILCWAPFLGALLASIGLVRTASTITRRHRRKYRTGVIVCTLILIVALAVTTFEVYQYTHNPWLLDDIKTWFMDRVTGGSYSGGYDYSGQYMPSMGMSDSLYDDNYTADGYYNENGEFVPYAEAEFVEVPENETGG